MAKTRLPKAPREPLVVEVSEVLRKHDPIRLFGFEGMPEDEYDGEAKKIIARRGECTTPEKTADVAHEVFVRSFDRSLPAEAFNDDWSIKPGYEWKFHEPSLAGPRADYDAIGADVFTVLQATR